MMTTMKPMGDANRTPATDARAALAVNKRIKRKFIRLKTNPILEKKPLKLKKLLSKINTRWKCNLMLIMNA